MKQIKLFGFLFAILSVSLFSLTSCSSDDEDDDEQSSPFVGKWALFGSSLNDGDIESQTFEFTESEFTRSTTYSTAGEEETEEIEGTYSYDEGDKELVLKGTEDGEERTLTYEYSIGEGVTSKLLTLTDKSKDNAIPDIYTKE